MPKQSAGILMYRYRDGNLEVLLVHPGGPFWRRKDAGVWSIPKGEYGPSEDAQEAARREFFEETGAAVSDQKLISLSEIRQAGGKIVTAWAVEGDCAAEGIKSNNFSMEWPPKSGKMAEFPEVDRAGWFDDAEARTKILASQAGFLDRLADHLDHAKLRPPNDFRH